METEDRIDKIFELLDKWKNLPAYQLERRADIFFALYLPEIIKQKFKLDDEVENLHIIPEFPVRTRGINKKTGKETFRSNRIDYAVVSKKIVYLVELKTDTGSINDPQKEYLRKTKTNKTNLIKDIVDIYHSENSDDKYKNLLSLLANMNWVEKIVNVEETSKKCKYKVINDLNAYAIEIVYILPEEIIKEEDITEIDFNYIAEILNEKKDVLTVRFIESLKKWTA